MEKFDTSGAIERGQAYGGQFIWSDFSPLAQGYVEAMAAWCAKNCIAISLRNFSFDMLAAEAVTMILSDCEAWLDEFTGRSKNVIRQDARCGREFYRIRQEGKRRTFPPVRMFVRDDGKVMLEIAK